MRVVPLDVLQGMFLTHTTDDDTATAGAALDLLRDRSSVA